MGVVLVKTIRTFVNPRKNEQETREPKVKPSLIGTPFNLESDPLKGKRRKQDAQKGLRYRQIASI